MNRNSIFVAPAKGGSLSVIDNSTGEELFTLPLVAGATKANTIDWVFMEGCTVQVSDNVAVVQPPARIAIMTTSKHHDSAVNPDWKPSAQHEQAKLMAELLKATRASFRKELNRERATARAEGERAAIDQARIDLEARRQAEINEQVIEPIEPPKKDVKKDDVPV